MKLHELFESQNRSIFSVRNTQPDTISGEFDCSRENLSSLKGGPKHVGGGFNCSYNDLEDLSFAPETVGGGFICSYNDLEDLSFAPETVGGSFSCTDNKLKNLIGAPKHVGGDFLVGRNELESLEGSPETVGMDFYCQTNKLKSLVGITKKVKDLCVYGNQLTNLHNIHKMVDVNGSADFLANPITSHVLGLLLMPKLQEVWLDHKKVQKIINKHLAGDRDVFACQEELIENGFEVFAQL